MSRAPKPPASEPTSYQVVARRFRPRTFGEIVGQEEVTTALRAALDADRVPHAFLFSGSRGVGKTTIARILARALNCERGVTSEPCGVCSRCLAILSESDPDVIEIDAASTNGVDDIRELREKAGYAPMRGRRKVFILDEVHMLSRGAFNAFLKILEEPPAHVTFILATTEIHKVPDTIRSRCQVHFFRRAGEAGIQERLAQICATEGVTVEPLILADIARGCRGGLRDAESALERILPLLRAQGAGFSLDDYRRNAGRMGLDRVAEVVQKILAGDAGAALHFAHDAASTGVDERECLGEMLEILRSLLHLKVDGRDSLLVPFVGSLRELLVQTADAHPLPRIEAAIQLVILGRDRIRRMDDRQLLLELTLLRMVRASEMPLLRELLERLENAPAAPAAARAPAGGAGASSQVVARTAPTPRPLAVAAAAPPAVATAAPPAVPPIEASVESAPAAPPARTPAPAPKGMTSAPPATAAAPASAARSPLLAEDFAPRLREALAAGLGYARDALRSARVELRDGGGTLVVTVAGVSSLLRDRLQGEAALKVFQDAVAALRADPVRVVVAFADAAAPVARPDAAPEPARREPARGAAPPAAPKPAAGKSAPGPLAEKVRQRFDGRFIDPNAI